MRADQLIVARGLAPTRSAAQRLIAQGAVRWLGPKGWAVPFKAGEDVPEDCELEVTDDAELRWVSRAGLKLDAALVHTGLDVTGRHCLDVGQSTGGFTEVLLAAQLPRSSYDLVVADLSFISLTLVLDALLPLAARDLLLLVKPQFELQPGDIGKHGLVNDPIAHGHVKARMAAACRKRGLVLRDYFESTVAGGDGNREHFVWASKP
jgi:23S rRNA (cytidine1920-2'-O)/16S rRNA (cytidine1409-2'-O)-methyltransferase